MEHKLDEFTIEMLKTKEVISKEVYKEMARQINQKDLTLWYKFLEVYEPRMEK